MAWAPLLLTLLTYCSGVSSQPVVTQEPSKSVTPGGTVTLSCSLSTGAITTSNYPSWYQQKPGSAPRMLIYETNKRPSGIPARFSGSISSNDAALAITGVQAEDEADYYCLIYTGSSGTIWGSETKTSRLHPLLQPVLGTGCTVWFLPGQIVPCLLLGSCSFSDLPPALVWPWNEAGNSLVTLDAASETTETSPPPGVPRAIRGICPCERPLPIHCSVHWLCKCQVSLCWAL
uniref:Ig-like domain-containing protein n=1 Tax=Gopherus evgoodei TaxID=1825980 RepID=A0A8C4WLU7_9SAUR